MPSSEDGQEDGQFTSFLSYMLEDLPCHKLNLGSKKSEGRDKLTKFRVVLIILKTKHLVGATARPVFHFLNIGEFSLVSGLSNEAVGASNQAQTRSSFALRGREFVEGLSHT